MPLLFTIILIVLSPPKPLFCKIENHCSRPEQQPHLFSSWNWICSRQYFLLPMPSIECGHGNKSLNPSNPIIRNTIALMVASSMFTFFLWFLLLRILSFLWFFLWFLSLIPSSDSFAFSLWLLDSDFRKNEQPIPHCWS